MTDKTGIVAGRSILGEDDVLTIADELVTVAPRWETLARVSPSYVGHNHILDNINSCAQKLGKEKICEIFLKNFGLCST